MRLTAAIGVVLALIAAGGLGVNRYVVAPLKEKIRFKDAQIEQAREAQRVADEYVFEANKRAAELDSRVEAALTETYGGCADAPIDPALLRAVGGL